MIPLSKNSARKSSGQSARLLCRAETAQHFLIEDNEENKDGSRSDPLRKIIAAFVFLCWEKSDFPRSWLPYHCCLGSFRFLVALIREIRVIHGLFRRNPNFSRNLAPGFL
jgi:hypothetical protein